MKLKKIHIIVIIIILLLSITGIFLYHININPTIIDNDAICSKNDDCVIVKQILSQDKPCCDALCDGAEAINKQAQKEREDWRSINCNNDYSCPIASCLVPKDTHQPNAICKHNQCEIK